MCILHLQQKHLSDGSSFAPILIRQLRHTHQIYDLPLSLVTPEVLKLNPSPIVTITDNKYVHKSMPLVSNYCCSMQSLGGSLVDLNLFINA